MKNDNDLDSWVKPRQTLQFAWTLFPDIQLSPEVLEGLRQFLAYQANRFIQHHTGSELISEG